MGLGSGGTRGTTGRALGRSPFESGDYFGWSEAARCESAGDGIAITIVDTFAPRDLSITADGPPVFGLSICLEGQGQVGIAGFPPVEIDSGTVIYFRANQTISGTNMVRGGRRVHFVDIRFDPTLLQVSPAETIPNHFAVEPDESGGNVLLMGFDAPATLIDIATQIVNCGMPQSGLRMLYLRGKALEALAVTIAAADMINCGTTLGRATERRRIQAARRLIDERCHERWTIAVLARKVGMSEKKLKSGFRRIVGAPVHAYLRMQRVHHAATLIGQGHSITEAALASGFGNLSHFSKTFRELRGVLPREYLRRGVHQKPGS